MADWLDPRLREIVGDWKPKRPSESDTRAQILPGEMTHNDLSLELKCSQLGTKEFLDEEDWTLLVMFYKELRSRQSQMAESFLDSLDAERKNELLLRSEEVELGFDE